MENPPQPVLDEQVLSKLLILGFNVEGAKRAVYFTTKNNISTEQHLEDSMEWIKVHMKDPDFENPFVPPGISSSKKENTQKDF